MISWNVPSKMHPCGLFERVKGVRIHYIRVGTGEHNLLLFPGPMGDARVDYSTFLELLDTKRKLFLWAYDGAVSRVPQLVENIDHWPKAIRAPLEAIYGTSYLADYWKEYTLAKRSNLLLNDVNIQAIQDCLSEQIYKGNGLSIFAMRAPGQLNTENWLTYLLTRFENVIVANWMRNDEATTLENNCCLWGPHRVNAKEFQTLVQGFLTEDKAVTRI
ncbi:uncharacterized protein DEA37_0001526 [Paragonimus westermani]|uniref:Uncharacterized protein n=1 Tax=Paragonimus westermani TaxID=34504 RepID=A0A5J4NMG1_9TREM|nr:uncharacterized protein DEA37_0001526 [Paragonimus westermani]